MLMIVRRRVFFRFRELCGNARGHATCFVALHQCRALGSHLVPLLFSFAEVLFTVHICSGGSEALV
jgi:hypothetical protein